MQDLLKNLPKELTWDVVVDYPTNPFTGDKLVFEDKFYTPYDTNGVAGDRTNVAAMNLYRSDTNELLAVGQSSYAIIPNYLFVDFVERVAEENPQYEFLGYQETEQGRRIYAFFQCDTQHKVNGTWVKTYLIIKTSHDKTSAFELYSYQVELVCTNGLMRKVRSVMNSVQHSGAAAYKVNALAFSTERWTNWVEGESAKRAALAKIKASEKLAWAYAATVQNLDPIGYFNKLSTLGVGTGDGVSTNSYNTVKDIYDAIKMTNNERNTGWTAANFESGLTRYMTHTQATDSQGVQVPLYKQIERFNGRHGQMIDRSDTFLKNTLGNAKIVAAYNQLPTP
jgi:hypothetical protein